MENTHISAHQNEPEYRMANTISAGQPPSNDEVQQTLGKIEVSLQERAGDGTLTPQAKKIALDTASVVQTLQRNIEDKNPDERLQQVVQDIQELQTTQVLPKTQRTLVGSWADFKELVLALVRSKTYRTNLSGFFNLFAQILGKEAKDAASAVAAGRFQEFAASKFTVEEREKWTEEFVTALKGFTGDERFRRTYYGFLHLFERIREQASEEYKQSPERLKIDKLYWDIRALLERFVAPKSFDDLWSYSIEFVALLKGNQQLQDYYTDLRHLMTDIFEDPTLLESVHFREKISFLLLDRGREIANNPEFKKQFERLLKEVRELLEAATNNPTSKDMRDNVQALISDFVHEDSYGNRSFDKKSLSDLVTVLTPMLRESLAQFKLPRLEGSDESMDWVIEDAILYGRHILPEYIDLRQSGQLGVRLPAQAPVIEHLQERLVLKLEKIFFHLKNVHFHYRQKTGLIKMADDILADVDMRGDGTDIEMTLEVDDRHRFRCTNVTCHIDSMKLKVYEARHNILYSIFKPILEGRVKKMIEQGIERQLSEFGDQVGMQIEKAIQGEGVVSQAQTLLGQ